MEAIQSFAALAVAVMVPWVMQLLKVIAPRLVCGAVMKRALVMLASAGVTFGLAFFLGTLQPTVESIAAACTSTATLFFAVEGAYRYMLKKEQKADEEEAEA
jgi:hypothetical protein